MEEGLCAQPRKQIKRGRSVLITRIMLSISGRFLPPHADEDDEEEAAEGEQDAADVDTVCRSIRSTITRRATAARPRSKTTRTRERGERLAREDGTAGRHTGMMGVGEILFLWVLSWTRLGWWCGLRLLIRTLVVREEDDPGKSWGDSGVVGCCFHR
jgi:hypothetical protein